MDLFGSIARHGEAQPDHVALGSSDLRTTLDYRQLVRMTERAADQLERLGLRAGDNIAMASDNNIGLVVALLATVSRGASFAPLDAALTPSELADRLRRLPTRAVIVSDDDPEQLDRWRDAGVDVSVWTVRVTGTAGDADVQVTGAKEGNATGRSSRAARDDDVALMLFTGGSSGEPKAVPLTHRNVGASIDGIVATYELTPTDVTLLVMPLFHGHGLIAGLLATLVSGGTAYVPSTGAFSAHRFWPDMTRVGATWYTAVPTIHRILVNRAGAEYPSAAPIPLRFIRSCSAPLDPALAAETSKAFHAPVIGAYGMTETAHQTTSNPLPTRGANKSDAVGRPNGLEIRIDRQSKEICVRGEAVTAGYLDAPDANAASFRDGWFRTGDLGSLDGDGYLHIEGRLKDLINEGGAKISPGDVDNVLLAHPAVLEAAAFGAPDPIYGEVVQAAVVLRAGAGVTEDEIRDFCRSKLSKAEVPARVFFADDLPQTAKGSIDRRAVAARFAPTEPADRDAISAPATPR